MSSPASLAPEIVRSALQAVRQLVGVYTRTRALTQEFEVAEQAISAALHSTEARAEFLQGLATAYAAGEIPYSAYQRILATVGRLSKSSADLASECERITRHARS